MASLVKAIGKSADEEVLSGLFGNKVAWDLCAFVEKVGVLKDMVVYKGFDPARMWGVVLDKFKKVVREKTIPMEITLGKQTWNREKSSVYEYLGLLTFIYLYRGTNVDKLLNKSNEDIRTAVDVLCGIFDIEKSPNKVTMTSTTPTISRLVALVPNLAVIFMNRDLGVTLAPVDLIDGHEIPRAFCTNLAAAMIPLSHPLHYLMITYSKAVDEVINTHKKHTSYPDLINYYRATSTSSLFKEPARKSFWVSLNLATLEGDKFSWIEKVISINDAAKVRLPQSVQDEIGKIVFNPKE